MWGYPKTSWVWGVRSSTISRCSVPVTAKLRPSVYCPSDCGAEELRDLVLLAASIYSPMGLSKAMGYPKSLVVSLFSLHRHPEGSKLRASLWPNQTEPPPTQALSKPNTTETITNCYFGMVCTYHHWQRSSKQVMIRSLPGILIVLHSWSPTCLRAGAPCCLVTSGQIQPLQLWCQHLRPVEKSHAAVWIIKTGFVMVVVG